VSVGGGYNAPPPATAPSFPQMGGFPQQPMQATYSGGKHPHHRPLPRIPIFFCSTPLCSPQHRDTGAGPAIATGPGGYWGNTTVTADVLEQHFPDPDDVDSFSTESVYIDSATQRYTLPQNSAHTPPSPSEPGNLPCVCMCVVAQSWSSSYATR
jgi:hypothetical protein